MDTYTHTNLDGARKYGNLFIHLCTRDDKSVIVWDFRFGRGGTWRNYCRLRLEILISNHVPFFSTTICQHFMAFLLLITVKYRTFKLARFNKASHVFNGIEDPSLIRKSKLNFS